MATVKTTKEHRFYQNIFWIWLKHLPLFQEKKGLLSRSSLKNPWKAKLSTPIQRLTKTLQKYLRENNSWEKSKFKRLPKKPLSPKRRRVMDGKNHHKNLKAKTGMTSHNSRLKSKKRVKCQILKQLQVLMLMHVNSNLNLLSLKHLSSKWCSNQRRIRSHLLLLLLK